MNDLRHMFVTLEQTFSDPELQDMLLQADFDQDGKVNFKDFLKMMNAETSKKWHATCYFSSPQKESEVLWKDFPNLLAFSTVPFGDQAKPKITFYCTTGFKALYAVTKCVTKTLKHACQYCV